MITVIQFNGDDGSDENSDRRESYWAGGRGGGVVGDLV